ncbi:hypothetical protein [Nocardia aurea]|uniref:hypothetical protein n=1 Tax=Nocardia aurea TaxID=2144174 RepID=UPI0013006D18|nr:hypothetical protein [Nocardia aurea]
MAKSGPHRRRGCRPPTRRHRPRRTFTDKASGKGTAQLDELLGVVRDGNTAEDLDAFTAVATAA